MNDETVDAQEAEVNTQPEESAEETQEGLPVALTPEEVTVNYPGFRTPQTEAEIHYELASIDVVIQSLKTRKAKLQRDWTHYKLTVHMNHQAVQAGAAEEVAGESE